MRTIATATVLMLLSAPAWADEPSKNIAKEPASANEPIVLSEAQMDGVTAGATLFGLPMLSVDMTGQRTTTTTGRAFGYTYDSNGN